MKQRALLAYLLAAMLLSACGAAGLDTNTASGSAPSENAAGAIMLAPSWNDSANGDAPAADAPAAAPAYAFEAVSDREESYHDDGTLLAYTDYEWQKLQITNPDALTEEDLALAERNVEAFNARLAAQFAEAKAESEVAGYAREAYEEGWSVSLPYSEKVTSTAALCGSIVTVRQDYYYNTGGAHPNSAADSLLFDLTAAQFIDPVQVADDPVAFHAAAAELLIEKADAMGPEYTVGYWQDYRDTIHLWDTSAAVTFDSGGMTVTFSPYDLGPYAMGFVELRLERAELEDLVGPGGIEKLGWTEAPEE